MMKIAVLGAGTMGTTYIHNLNLMKDVKLVGVFDINEAALQKAAAIGNTKPFTNLDELISDTDPDLVCVCLPSYLHKEFVLKLASYKKHIVCEKPLALNVTDAIEMKQACNTAGVKLFVGHVLRFFPNYVDLKKKLDLVGEVKVARTKRYSGFPRGSDNWFADSAKSGGIIMDLLIHDIDYLRWTMGEVASAYTLLKETEGKQIAYVTLKFESGAIGQLSAMWGYGGPFTTTCELACEKGLIRLNNRTHHSLELISDNHLMENNAEKVSVPKIPLLRDAYYRELEHFIHCLREDASPIITTIDAIQAIAIVQAAITSAELQKPVDVAKIAKGV